jgi:hypothetical protein
LSKQAGKYSKPSLIFVQRIFSPFNFVKLYKGSKLPVNLLPANSSHLKLINLLKKDKS